jgi:hypothetical protein
MKRAKKKKHAIRILLIAGCFFTVVAGFASYLFCSYHTPIPDKYYSGGPNAVWARHQWAGAPKSERRYKQFFDLLKRNKITDCYFHVGPFMGGGGEIPPEKYRYAPQLIRAARRIYPGLRVHAWVGQTEKQGGGPLDISSPETRAQILKTSAALLNAGFDGIHYDIEPIHDNDRNFIGILKETKKITASENKLLSVASAPLEPVTGSAIVINSLAKTAGYWSAGYYAEVAGYADQIAVMMYDTALPADWMYGSLVESETAKLRSILCGKTTLFMGAPTYENDRPGHHTRAENIRSALIGIRKGIARGGEIPECSFGVAVFAEWTTTPSEWKIFQHDWLNEK